MSLLFRAKPIETDEPNRGGDMFPDLVKNSDVWELERVKYQLSKTANDPNLTLFTNYSFDLVPTDTLERKAEWED